MMHRHYSSIHPTSRQKQRSTEDCHKFCDDDLGHDDDVRLNAKRNRNNKNNKSQQLGLRRLVDYDSNNLGHLTTGALRNLVVLIRFADHVTAELPSPGDLDAVLNADGGHPTLAPTGSVKDYFHHSSYGKLTVESVVSDWITVSRPEEYYADNASGSTGKMEEALREALTKLDVGSGGRSSGPSILDEALDRDANSILDSVMFLTSGYAAEWGKTDCRGNPKEDRIWSHQWSLRGGGWTSSNGLVVRGYHLSSALWGTCGKEVTRVGTLVHEIAHTIGLPDLYGESNGVGSYSGMANSWGIDGSQRYPPTMDPWSKIAAGWLIPTPLEASGTYELPPSATDDKVYIITEGFPEDEYLLVENRQPIGFDAALPQGGLIVYHVDDDAPFTSRPGHPDQLGWPANGNHYRVAVVPADGSYDLEKNINRGDSGDAWHNSQRGLSSPLTDSYQGGNIAKTGHRIEKISSSSTSMKFDFILSGQAAPTPDPPAPQPEPSQVTITTNSRDRTRGSTTTAKVPETSSTSSMSASSPDEMELVSSYAGGNGSFGNVFDVVAKKDGLLITSLDLHTRVLTPADAEPDVDLQVYTKAGSHEDYATETDRSKWRKIVDTKIRGMGNMNASPIPPEAFEAFTIAPGETHAIYVTLNSADIRYTSSDIPFGEPVVSNEHLDILQGSGIGDFPWGPAFKKRQWNGSIKYKVLDPATTTTTAPTDTTNTATTTTTADALADAGLMKAGQGKITTKSTANVKTRRNPISGGRQKGGKQHSLSTSFDANNGGCGSMFNVEASSDVKITSLGTHIRSTESHNIDVYMKQGSHDGYELSSDAWEHVYSGVVAAKGPGKPTIIDGFDDVFVAAESTVAFYISSEESDLRYTTGDHPASDSTITISGGAGISDPNFQGKAFTPRAANVVLTYELQ